jgi:hypothetical protein
MKNFGVPHVEMKVFIRMIFEPLNNICLEDTPNPFTVRGGVWCEI